MTHKRLLETETRWRTRVGKAFLSDRIVLHGEDLHRDLGDSEWIRLYLHAILGRDPGERVADLLGSYWVSTAYPDPSIWPNHVTALAASARSTASLSLMAGLSVSEASIYGRRPEVRALDFFYRAGEYCDGGGTLEDFVEREKSSGRTLYGYGRPLAKTDERIPFMMNKAREYGFADGRYLKMSFDVYEYLNARYGFSMNIAALHAGLAADIGLNCRQYQLFMTPCFLTGMVPCYQEAIARPEGSFFPVRCESVEYEGPPKRDWFDTNGSIT
ncbi:citrate/2-methylcitrate synthase [Marinobacter sp. DUT-1]|uniref:citrate/2-methylcitrate synthase n=1 Tax=Marinobacter sp. DUT-1 TaxID=3412037 RepID=UPI003D1732D1